ncbi:hypothetical protein ColTof3_10945 [Colletotrichum tofieldiae]|nr:hypothetical protein ColTof3_10945 [Colletotrichum tofieldiae]
MAEAGDFFQARRPSWTFEHMQSLVPASRRLTRPQRSQSSCALYAEPADTGVVERLLGRSYQLSVSCRPPPSIAWRRTWDAKLERGAIRGWEKAARNHTRFALRFELEPRILAHVDSHAHAIELSDLPRGVIDPTSLWQIQKDVFGLA